MRLKHTTAILATRFAEILIKNLNAGGGTSFPGKIALKISPDILSFLVNQTKKEIITISGTNGKTTTAGLLSSILKNDGRKIAHNRKGANMLTGITGAVVQESCLFNGLNVDNCLLEVDEAFLVHAYNHFNPNYLLVTNLFRDQLDRYGELDTTAKKIQAAIDKTISKKPLSLVLNADDPVVSRLGSNQDIKKIYYGFNEINFVNQDVSIKSPQEIATCVCGEKYSYSKVFYGQVGHYSCSCGKARPAPEIEAVAEIDVEFSILKIKHNDSEFEIRVNLPGVYNAYNALAAITLALDLGISVENIQKGIDSYDTVFGRAEKLVLKNKPVLIQLIKNPIGATEVLRTVKDDESSKLLIIINDNYADGRDVSWLWDANFELLNSHKKRIVTSGVRASDMAVRLKYAGIPAENIKVVEDIKAALDYSVNNTEKDEKLYVLPTYTALLSLQPILKKY